MLFWFCFGVAKTIFKNFIFPEFCSFETNDPTDTEFHTLFDSFIVSFYDKQFREETKVL